MKFILILLLCAVFVIAVPKSNRTEVRTSRQERRMFSGIPSRSHKHTYMASLQLDNVHICSSAIFQKGYLVTTGQCASLIDIGREKKQQKASAVLGDPNLLEGQRVGIESLEFHPSFHDCYPVRLNNFWDLAVIKIADGVDYSSLEVLDILPNKGHFRVQGSKASICGWVLVTDGEEISDEIENKGYIDNLRCMDVNLYSYRICSPIMPYGDFQRRLICGRADDSKQGNSLGDFGSPLVMSIKMENGEKDYLVGIALHQYQALDGIYFRFIRADRAFEDIQKILHQFKPLTGIHVSRNNNSSSQRNLPDKQTKRRKVDKISSENSI